MAAGIGLGISIGWKAFVKKTLGPTVDGIFAILQGRSQNFENEASSKAQVQVLDTAGVLGKASLVITPTAYNNGKLNAVLPSSSPFGDLNKAGGTNATRINSSGEVEVMSSTNPRIDYEESDPAILCEYQTSNYLKYSEAMFSAAGSPWTTSGLGTSFVSMTLPDGSSGNIANHYAYGVPGTISQSAILQNGKGAGFSVWAYNPETTAHNISLKIVGYSGGGNPQSLPPGVWTRVKLVTPATPSPLSITGVEITLATGKYTRLWGGQLEPTQFLNRTGVVTSYIPTNSGSVVTRVGELIIGQSNSSQINSEEGVFLFEGKMTNSGTNEFVNIIGNGGINSNALSIYGTGGGTVSGRMRVGGVDQYFPVNGSLGKTHYNKYAVKWDGTTIKTFVNGVSVYSAPQSNSFAAGVLNQVNLSQGQRFYGRIKMLAIFKEALTDAEVIAITT